MEGNDDLETGTLWDDFRRGDDVAYARIYKRYADRLYRQGFHYTRNKEIIKDCLQEVFTKIYQYRTRLSPTDNVRNYLMASMRNQLITVLAREKARTRRRLPHDIPNADTTERSAAAIIEEQEDERETARAVDRVLALLTERQREAIRYRYIDGLDTADICRRMSLNYQSLQNILSRALKKIREHLDVPRGEK
jgi:RNA polymerase sigma factor (sigma-70 family)